MRQIFKKAKYIFIILAFPIMLLSNETISYEDALTRVKTFDINYGGKIIQKQHLESGTYPANNGGMTYIKNSATQVVFEGGKGTNFADNDNLDQKVLSEILTIYSVDNTELYIGHDNRQWNFLVKTPNDYLYLEVAVSGKIKKYTISNSGTNVASNKEEDDYYSDDSDAYDESDNEVTNKFSITNDFQTILKCYVKDNLVALEKDLESQMKLGTLYRNYIGSKQYNNQFKEKRVTKEFYTKLTNSINGIDCSATYTNELKTTFSYIPEHKYFVVYNALQGWVSYRNGSQGKGKSEVNFIFPQQYRNQDAESLIVGYVPKVLGYYEHKEDADKVNTYRKSIIRKISDNQMDEIYTKNNDSEDIIVKSTFTTKAILINGELSLYADKIELYSIHGEINFPINKIVK